MHRRRRATVLVLALIAAGSALAPSPAGGSSVSTFVTTTIPVTWVDGQGRQTLVTSATETDDSGIVRLQVARDLPTGQPDLTWGSSGYRDVLLAPPSAGVTIEGWIGATDDGVLSTVWRLDSCGNGDVCDRWFARYAGTEGTGIGTPTLVEDAPPLLRALDDGSFLTGTEGQALGRRSATGADLGDLPIAANELGGADVDGSGRLILATTNGVMGAFSPGDDPIFFPEGFCLDPNGPVPVAVGASPDGSSAVACYLGSPMPELRVVRLDEDGFEMWRATGDADDPIRAPQRVAITDDGKVWVAGTAPDLWPIQTGTSGHVAVVPATALHIGQPVYDRPTATGEGTAHHRDLAGGGIVDLREVGDRVALADLQVCCVYGSNQTPDMYAHSRVVPPPPEAPACTVPSASVTDADEQSIDITFLPCDTYAEHQAPTGYRVDVTGFAGTGSAGTGPGLPGVPITVHVDGLAGGRYASAVVVPVNAQGDSTGFHHRADTVLPFTSRLAMVQRMFDDLTVIEPGDLGPIFASDLSSAEDSPERFVDILLRNGLAKAGVEPVARYYRSFLLRDPDPGGLGYWTRKLVAGTSRTRVAEQLVGSADARWLRSGTNRQFVALAYRSSLYREADQAGLAYWAKQLDQGRTTRLRVILGLTDSAEGLRRSLPVEGPLAVAWLMLGRLPTASESGGWQGLPEPRVGAAHDILASAEYAARVHGPP